MSKDAGGRARAVLGVTVLTMLLALPAGASAVTVTVGRAQMIGFTGQHDCLISFPLQRCNLMVSPTAVTSIPGLATIPADGQITAWRAKGYSSGDITNNSWALRVLRPVGAGFEVISSSAEVGFPNGETITVGPPALAVRAGDSIGLVVKGQNCMACTGFVGVWTAPATGSAFNDFSNFVNNYEVGGTFTPDSSVANQEPLFSADVVLDPPVVSGVSPSSGTTEGGETVTITGDHLSAATQVSFGNTTASGVNIVSTTQVTAVSPAVAAPGSVDITVETPAGVSAVSAADQFTYVSPAPPADTTAPVLGALAITPSKFKAARSGESILLAAPATSQVSYSVSEAATVTFTVKRAAKGRRVGKRCVRPKPSNQNRRPCKRFISVSGDFSDEGVSGSNDFTFSGRIGGRTLRPARYRLESVATDAGGNVSTPETASFQIVR